MRKLFILFAVSFALTLFDTGCGKSDAGNAQEEPPGPAPAPGDEIDWSKVDPAATVRGVVTSGGVGVQGVVITDGVNMTRTNKQGAYGLRTSAK